MLTFSVRYFVPKEGTVIFRAPDLPASTLITLLYVQLAAEAPLDFAVLNEQQKNSLPTTTATRVLGNSIKNVQALEKLSGAGPWYVIASNRGTGSVQVAGEIGSQKAL